MKKIIVLVLTLLCMSCASGRKNKILSGMALSFAGGYAAGQSLTPAGDNRDMHGALYGSALSAIVGAGMVYFLSESEELKNAKNRIVKLTDESANIRRNRVEKSNGNLLPKTDRLPEEIRKLIKPGAWKLFEIDDWIRSGNTLIHQDREIIFEPAELKK